MEHRGTDTPEVINDRVEKAAYELTFADRFDRVLINDDLETAKAAAYQMVSEFLDIEH